MNDTSDQRNRVNDDQHAVVTGTNTMADPGRRPWIRCLMQVLWPAFLGATVSVGLFFSVIDPSQIEWVHTYLNDSAETAYTVGFILFWIVHALTCSITWFLASTQALLLTPRDRKRSLRRS